MIYKKNIFWRNIFKLTKKLLNWPNIHPQNTDESTIFPQPLPPHTYLANFFQHLLLWGLESSEQEAEVKKERLEGEPWHQPHTRSSPEILQQGWHHSSEVQTPANDKKGVQPEHDKRWDSSALWKIRKLCYKDLIVQFQHYDSLVHIFIMSQPQNHLSDWRFKVLIKKCMGEGGLHRAFYKLSHLSIK